MAGKENQLGRIRSVLSRLPENSDIVADLTEELERQKRKLNIANEKLADMESLGVRLVNRDDRKKRLRDNFYKMQLKKLSELVVNLKLLERLIDKRDWS